MRPSPWLIAAALSLPLLACSSGEAPKVQLRCTLSGGSEVPPNNTAGTGACDATLNPSTRGLSYTIAYSGLTGTATNAYFQGPALPGRSALPVVPLGSPVSPIRGDTLLSEAQIKQVLDGLWYVSIQTEAHPKGEIRGQLVRAP